MGSAGRGDNGNPSFSVIAPLLSRSLLLTLRPLESEALEGLVRRALSDERGLAGRFAMTDEAVAWVGSLGWLGCP